MKELPYFRFTGTEWLTDDISFESYETKGVFIDVCAFYWIRDCAVTKELLFKRFSNATPMLQQLFDSGIIKLDEKDDFLEILFLDKQWKMLYNKHKKRSKAGKLGGLRKSSNAKAKPKQCSSYKDKDKDKDKDKSIYPFERFWDDYDRKEDRRKAEQKYSKVSEADRLLIKEHIPKYKAAQPDKQWRKQPATYLNNESWKNEIIKKTNGGHFDPSLTWK